MTVGLDPITLAEMDAIRLMDRTDTKFVTSRAALEAFLEAAREGGYRALEIGGHQICRYDTVYYDTPGLDMYLDHHNRRLVRQKVRVRTYCDTGASFLEIKKKNNHGRTKKKRMQCAADDVFGEGQSSFLLERSGYRPSDLRPALRTVFDRITLVNPGMTERLTIDMDLRFENLASGGSASLGDAVVMELKRDGKADGKTPDMLASAGIHRYKVSKYCIGTAMTAPDVKQNRFKAKIRQIEKFSI